MSHTYTQSQSSTYTEARAKHVMGKVYEDLIGLNSRGLISIDRAEKIKNDILYLLNKEALKFFQLQFNNSKGEKIGGLHYELNVNGHIVSDEDSGNINYWSLASDTKVGLLVQLDYSSSKIDEVNKQLESWGWGSGKALEGTQEHLKSYSKDGYGLKQSKIGTW